MSKRYNRAEYRGWREALIAASNECYVCGSKEHLHAHHIDSYSYFPDKRYKVDNGIILCSEHHKMYHTSYNRSYRVKTTRKNFNNYLELLTKQGELSGVELTKNKTI